MVLVYKSLPGTNVGGSRKSRQHWPILRSPLLTCPTTYTLLFFLVPQPEFVPFTPSVVLGGNKTENSKGIAST